MAPLIQGLIFLGLIIHIHSYDYGFNNSYTCHCLNNTRCDTVTGRCNDGCLKRWGGQSCQKENVALDSNDVRQTGIFKNKPDQYGPRLVVDGYISTDRSIHPCSDTGYTPWAWWSIDLQQTYSIGYIKIFHRKGDQLRFLKGFSVHIDNELCFKHPGISNLPAEYLIECSKSITGRYVNISNIKPDDTRHYIVLCEVEIYVCSQGTYGSDCNNFCHCSNYDQCDVITGQCPNGCQIGWYGDSCNTSCSVINKYGPECKKNCNARQCFGTPDCDHVTGKCIDGCKPGYRSIDCRKKCPPGKYGDRCSKQCNNRQCTGSQQCYHVTGKCNDGCKPGYRGQDCYWKCPSDRYGDRCSKQCNNRQCTGSQQCNHITGQCNDGCKPGYIKDDCTVECPSDKYGDRCSKQCNNRQCTGSQQCNHITGQCDDGCKPGYRGQDCSWECPSDRYGDRCSKQCNNRQCTGSQHCNHITGKCIDRCKPGYIEDDCTKKCTDDFYGVGCKKNCKKRECLKTSTCDHVTGECIGGCAVGFDPTVLDCTQECEAATYGPGCSKKCTDRNCSDSSLQCDSKTGECINGCRPGFQLLDCTQECNDGVYGYNCSSNCSARFCQSANECNNIDGACDCLDGYAGTDCTVIKEAIFSTDPGSKSIILASAVSVCIVLICIAVLVVFLKRRQPSNSGESCPKQRTVDTVAFVQPQADAENGPIYENSAVIIEATQAICSTEQSRDDKDETGSLGSEAPDNLLYGNILPVDSDFNLRELEEFVNNTIICKGFADLYKAMFDDFTSSYDVSHIQANRNKNRFKGYYPYDATRVILEKLPGYPHSDYINANYMNGYDGKKFIGAQGATVVTIDDFVRMIWDTKCEKVVMVTREFEGGKTKCLQYWPEQGTKVFGEIKLTLKMEKRRANYTKRYISMERDGTTHELCHFHYVSWPDHGVPDVHDMLDFQYTVNKYNSNSSKPVLVHCSAGVGRTGTYIAIDYCLKRYYDIGKVDVLECVKRLREQRKGMVQTTSQLQFIHEAVIEGIKRGDTSVNKDKFEFEYEKHKHSIKMGNSTLRQQLAYLTSVKHNQDAVDNSKQIISEKVHLYRYSSFTCVNSILFEDLVKFSKNDIWKAIHKIQTPVVVFLLDSKKDDVCPNVGAENIHDDCVVTTKSKDYVSDELNKYCVSISTVQGQSKQQVNVSILNMDKCTSKKHSTLYRYIMETIIQLATSHNDFDPIVLFSSDTYNARIFCILLNIFQRIKLDDEVEIFQVVRKMHSQFGLTIKTQEEYDNLHEVVFDFIKARSTYANL